MLNSGESFAFRRSRTADPPSTASGSTFVRTARRYKRVSMSGQAAPLETEQDFAAASGGSESVVVAEGTIEQKQEQDSPSAMQPVADSGGQQQHRETVASGKQGDTGADVAVAREDSNVDAKPSAPPEKTESTTPAGKPAAEVPSERRAEGSISGGDAESRPAQKHEAPSASPTRQDGAGSQDRNDNDAVKQRRDEGAGSVRSPRKNEETKQEALEETSKKVAGGGDVQDELPKTNVGDQEKIAATPAKPDVKPKESHVTGEGGPAKDEGGSAGKEAPDTPKSGEGDSSADGKVQASDEYAASPPSKGAAGGEGARQQQQQPTSAPSSPKKKKKKAKKKVSSYNIDTRSPLFRHCAPYSVCYNCFKNVHMPTFCMCVMFTSID